MLKVLNVLLMASAELKMSAKMSEIITCLTGLLCIYITLQGTTSTLVYKDVSLKPREVFVVYNSLYTLSSSVGRSSSCVISVINPSFNSYTKHTWALATTEVALMLVLLMDSWYRFLNNTFLVCLLIACLGLTFGILYVNAIGMVGQNEVRKSEIVRAFFITASAGGNLMAGMLALYVEPIVYQHCLYITNAKAELCLARSTRFL